MIIVIVIIAADLPRGVDNVGRVRQHLHHHRLRHLQPPLAVKLLAGLHHLSIYFNRSKYGNHDDDGDHIQAWVHPHLFPWLLPFIQISLNGSIWSNI